MSGEVAQGAADRMKHEVEETKPDLVVWQLGTNDALASRQPRQVQELREDDAVVARRQQDRRGDDRSAVRRRPDQGRVLREDGHRTGRGGAGECACCWSIASRPCASCSMSTAISSISPPTSCIPTIAAIAAWPSRWRARSSAACCRPTPSRPSPSSRLSLILQRTLSAPRPKSPTTAAGGFSHAAAVVAAAGGVIVCSSARLSSGELPEAAIAAETGRGNVGIATSGLLGGGTAWAGAAVACCARRRHCAADAVAARPRIGRPCWAVSELRAGALDHDTTGLWSGFGLERPDRRRQREVLFTPWARTFGGYLRPAIGATVNFNGDTSKVYADVRWEIEAPSGVFFAMGMGAALHDGHLGTDDPAPQGAGAYVLFHPSAELGYRFNGVNSISIFADHISNGFTRRNNEGMDTVGIRFGHRFGPPGGARRDNQDIPIGDFSGPYIGALAGYRFDSVDWSAVLPTQCHDQRFRLRRLRRLPVSVRQGRLRHRGGGIPLLKGSLSTVCVGAIVTCKADVTRPLQRALRFGWVLRQRPDLRYRRPGDRALGQQGAKPAE